MIIAEACCTEKEINIKNCLLSVKYSHEKEKLFVNYFGQVVAPVPKAGPIYDYTRCLHWNP